MKKIIICSLVLSFLFLIGFTGTSRATDTSDVSKAIEILSKSVSKQLSIHENTGKHDHFPTTWKMHYAMLIEGSFPGGVFQLIVRDYRSYYTVHDACGFTIIILVDYNKDGKVDEWTKAYYIKLDNRYILSPPYPPGYLNKDWNKMTQEEAQKVYDEELKYFIENSGLAK